jgi:small conductance mechanosensitive channel
MKNALSISFIIVLILTVSPLAQGQAESRLDADSLVQHDLTPDHRLDELQLLVTPLTLEQLSREAEEWQEIVQASMSRVASLKVAAMNTEGEQVAQIHELINDLSTERLELIGKFDLILDSMESKGADPELVAGYRNYISGALASEFQATDFKTILSRFFDWTTSADGGLSVLIRIAIAIGLLFLLIITARFVRALAARAVRRISHLSQLMQDFLLKVTFWLTFAIGIMIVLSVLGVNITPLFAVLGGASFILAFAMQETLGNLAAGLMIMINKPFDVGDLIDTNGVIGEVEAVSIVSTTVRTLDNQVVILPNSQVWGSIITNVTVSPVRRVDMVFGIGYGDDIDTATQVLERLVRDHPLVLDEPEPRIAVHELADSSVNFVCRPWTKTENYWDVYWDITRQAKEGFDQAGVSIPFPQRDVHLFQQSS